MAPAVSRDDRPSGEKAPAPPDERTAGQLDRDRILYSTEFRRLAGVTQVVSPGQEEIFHNRLTHTLKVAQIARRLAETFIKKQPDIATAWGGIDPDVVEAAAMAHDLGHPPFGHLAEEELDDCVRRATIKANQGPLNKTQQSRYDRTEGYEGNAQSFRIITRLAVRRKAESPFGLDLTRATLNATLKYPKQFVPGEKKYGAYRADSEAFGFARDGATSEGDARSIEAQIMDWADDIAYSVHDVEDFYRAGLIPLDRLSQNIDDQHAFRERVERRWPKIGRKSPLPEGTSVASIVAGVCSRLIRAKGPYDGTRQRRAELYEVTSSMIHELVSATRLRPPDAGDDGLEIEPKLRCAVTVLKELIWFYIIESPSLAAQQHGQREAVRSLFWTLYEAHAKGQPYLYPAAFRWWP
jgi:dGTPase